MDLTVITNHVPRNVIDAYELSLKEREDFDYLAWDKIDAGEDSASFFRYKGELYDLNDCEIFSNLPDGPWAGQQWDGIYTESFFSGILVRYTDADCERVIVARYYS